MRLGLKQHYGDLGPPVNEHEDGFHAHGHDAERVSGPLSAASTPLDPNPRSSGYDAGPASKFRL